jgi:hypothetical protein
LSLRARADCQHIVYNAHDVALHDITTVRPYATFTAHGTPQRLEIFCSGTRCDILRRDQISVGVDRNHRAARWSARVVGEIRL